MNMRELIALIRQNIAALRTKGATSVTIASLESLLAAVENHVAQQPDTQINSITVEHARLQQAADLAGFAARSAVNLEVFKSVFPTTQVAVKSLIIINGGAAVALLALIGHLVSTPGSQQTIHRLAVPLLWFVGGVWAGASLGGFVALGQKLYGEALNPKRTYLKHFANVSVIISILFGLGSLVAFAVGSYVAYFVFTNI
jgi:hypothetical protein